MAELAKLEEDRQKLLEEYPELHHSSSHIEEEDTQEVVRSSPSSSHGYVSNPLAEKVFAKSSRQEWLSNRLAFLYSVKSDVLKEITSVQNEL